MTARSIIVAMVLATATAAAGCARVTDPGPAMTDPALLHRDHPLAGRIWETARGGFVREDDVVAALSKARFALIGEKHDNPAHHRIQANLVGAVIAAGRRPSLVFEMLTASQQPAIDAYLADNPGNASGLGPAVGWETSGWPDWALYRPIFDAGLAAGTPVLAGGLDRDTIRGVARNGADALGEDRGHRLRLDEPIPDSMRAEMRDEVYVSHCEQLPEPMLDPMVTVTLAKDAVMAERLIEGASSPGRNSAVLIAGDGHVRADRGVPWHLRKLAAGSTTVSIGILEVVAGEDDPAAYAESFGVTALPYDFVWFTPRVDDQNPCDVFAESLRKARERREKREQAPGN